MTDVIVSRSHTITEELPMSNERDAREPRLEDENALRDLKAKPDAEQDDREVKGGAVSQTPFVITKKVDVASAER